MIHVMASQSNESLSGAKANPFVVSQYVDVQSRTWPGINKPGGIGRVSGVAGDRVSVRYLVGRRHEKEIPIQYVKPYDIPSERLRDRALLKGRCTNCGSLRNDCGSCDLSLEQVALLGGQRLSHRQSATRQMRDLKNEISDLAVTEQPERMDFDFDSQSSSSSSDEEIEMQQRRYRRYMQLKKRAQQILENCKEDSSESSDDSEESDEDNVPLRQLVRQELLSQLSPIRGNRGRNNDKYRQPQRKNHRPVLNDSSDSEVELVALSDASSSRSVSPPGTPDFSVDNTQQNERDTIMNNNDGNSSESEVSNATVSTHDNEQPLDSTLRDFIEPEGDAMRMPQDTVDRTETLKFADLGAFFDDLARSLANKTIPWARKKVRELVRQFETDRSPTKPNFVLRKRCSELYGKLMSDLVRSGIDQCQRALKRLEVKPDLQLENRGLLWDKLRDEVEDVLRELRALLNALDEVESDIDEINSDDGWAEPTDSPPKLLNQEIVDNLLSSKESTSPMDLHPHASKKRRGRTSLKSKIKHSQKKSGRKLFRDRSMKKGQGLLSETAKVRHYGKENQNDQVSLRSNVLKSTRSKTRRRESGHRKRSETAVERMERFLLLNTADGIEDVIDNENEDGNYLKSSQTSTKSRTFIHRRSRLADEASSVAQERRRRKQGVGRSFKSDECASLPQMKNGSLSHYLLQGLQSREPGEGNRDMDQLESTAESSRSLVDVCDDLKKVFPQSVCCSFFKELLLACSSDGQVVTPTVFNFVLSLMKDFGSLTIQELVSQESSQLKTYVAMYVFILKLLKRNFHCGLSAQHGIAYKIFGATNSKFVDFLFLQFLDAVYALAHPVAWDLKVSNRRQAFESLSPLRDALGEQFALIEQASCFIDTRLGRQTWRLVASRRALFVSSIDPDSWKLYIEQAIEPESVVQSRFRSIGSVPCIPRVEVETLWRVLVFLAASTSTVKPEKGSRHRWKFIHELFLNGVFRMPEKTGSPSVRHLEAVEEDINNLSSIISSGAIEPLPRKDSVVIEFIRKTLLLHAEALWHSEELREAQLPSIDDGKTVLKRELSSSESWRDLRFIEASTFAPIAFTELLEKLLAATKPTKSSMFAAGPASCLLHSSLMLQFGWMASARRESDARMHHCDQAFRTLVKYFEEESKNSFCGENDNQIDRDAFQDAFPDSSILMCKGGLPDSRKSLFLQECATYLSIVAQISTSAAQGMNQKDSALLQITKKSWEILGYDEMGNPEETLDVSASTSFDILRPYVMAKVLHFLLFWALGIAPATENETTARRVPDHVLDKEAILYIASGLTRCLEVSSHSGCSEVIYSIASMTEKVLVRIYHAIAVETIDHQFFASVIDMRCVRASLNTINVLFKATFCGVEDDICLLSVLSLLRTALSFRRTKHEETESLLLTHSQPYIEQVAKSNDPTDDEIWGDLNDDELLCMMDSVEGGPSVGNSTSGTLQSWKQLCFALSESLRCAIPSLRYEISHSDEQASRMSSHGKLLVSRRVKAISMTLISILVSEQGLPFSSLADLVRFRVSDNVDDEDYRRKVLLNCCRGLCNSTVSPRARSLINCSSSSMVSIFINALLDINRLQNVPSCSFDRLPDDGCDARKRKAVDDFLKFSSGNSSSRKAATVWTFCRELGDALSISNEDGAPLFKQVGADISDLAWDNDDQAVIELPCSLEKEYLCRFRCIQGIISTHQLFDVPHNRTFSELCAEIIARSFEGLLRIQKLLHVEEVASNGSTEPSYAEFRLTELFRCHSEFSMSILAWMFREGSRKPCAYFRELWTTICTDFIVPMISSDTIGVYTCIEKTYTSVSVFLGTPPLSFPKCIELYANGECHKILSGNLISYSREILLPMLVSESRTLQIVDKFLSAAVRDSKAASKSICRIFFKDTLLAPSSLTETGESKFCHHLRKQWDSLQTDHPLDPKLEGELANLKQHTMETLVVIAKRNKRESRQGALHIISSILRRERKEAGSEALKLEVVGSLIRALPLLLKESLLEPAVDEEMFALIYKCVHNISRRRANKNEEATLAEWRAAKCLQSEHQDPKTILSSKYVTSALEWFETIGNIVLGQDEGCDSERMRLHLGEDGSDGWLSWESVTCSANLAHISHKMKEIERELFPSLYSDRVVHNVYAATKRTSPAEAISEKWVPSNRIRQLLQTFNNK